MDSSQAKLKGFNAGRRCWNKPIGRIFSSINQDTPLFTFRGLDLIKKLIPLLLQLIF